MEKKFIPSNTYYFHYGIGFYKIIETPSGFTIRNITGGNSQAEARIYVEIKKYLAEGKTVENFVDSLLTVYPVRTI